MNYKEKYKKYKKKYQMLSNTVNNNQKNFITNNTHSTDGIILKGGVEPTYFQYVTPYTEVNGYTPLFKLLINPIQIICDDIGFHQHIGECWHDTLQMIFCFSDGIKGYAQKVLYNLEPDQMIDLALYYNKTHIIPLFYRKTPEDFDNFREMIKPYLQAFKNRFMNHHNHIANKIIPITKKRIPIQRSISMNEGITCAKEIKLITRNDKTVNSSSGSNLEDYMVISILSFILLKDKKIINKQYRNSINLKLEDLEDLNSVSIIMTFPKQKIGHAVGFYTCNGIRKFYDDENGIITYDWINYLEYIIKYNYTSRFGDIDGKLYPLLEMDNTYYLLNNILHEIPIAYISNISNPSDFNLLKIQDIPSEKEIIESDRINLIELFIIKKNINWIDSIIDIVGLNEDLILIALETNLEIFKHIETMLDIDIIKNINHENDFICVVNINRIKDIMLFDYIVDKYFKNNIDKYYDNLLISTMNTNNMELFKHLTTQYSSLLDINKTDFSLFTITKPNEIKSSFIILGIGCEEGVLFFINNGASIEHMDNSGDTAFLLSLKYNLPNIASIILDYMPNLNVIDNDGFNTFDLAFKNNMETIALFLLDNDISVNNLKIEDIILSLKLYKNIYVIESLFLKYDYIIDLLLKDKDTDELFYSINTIINLLLKNNIDNTIIISKLIKMTDNNFKLYNYISYRQMNNTKRILHTSNILSLLGNNNENIDSMILKNADYYNIKLICELIDYDVDKLKHHNINELLLRSVQSSTVYMEESFIIFINWLIQQGANLMLEDVDKNNLLLISISNMKFKMVDYFINKINVELVNNNNDNIFHVNLKTFSSYSSDYNIFNKKIKNTSGSIFTLLLKNISDKKIIQRMLTIDKNKNGETVLDLIMQYTDGIDYMKHFFAEEVEEIVGIKLQLFKQKEEKLVDLDGGNKKISYT